MLRDARDLHEIREALRYHEEGQLAEIAETLARAAKDISEAMQCLDAGNEWLDAKGAAEYLGISDSQFKAISQTLPRRYVSERHIRYRRSHLDAWLEDRDELWRANHLD